MNYQMSGSLTLWEEYIMVTSRFSSQKASNMKSVSMTSSWVQKSNAEKVSRRAVVIIYHDLDVTYLQDLSTQHITNKNFVSRKHIKK